MIDNDDKMIDKNSEIASSNQLSVFVFVALINISLSLKRSPITLMKTGRTAKNRVTQPIWHGENFLGDLSKRMNSNSGFH